MALSLRFTEGILSTGCPTASSFYFHGLSPLHRILVGGLYTVYSSRMVTHIFLPVVYLIFRFITGFCGSAFLSVAGGSVSDLFSNATVAKLVSAILHTLILILAFSPMAVYTISPFIGPALGPLLSGCVHQPFLLPRPELDPRPSFHRFINQVCSTLVRRMLFHSDLDRQSLYWRWTWRIQLIWVFTQCIALYIVSRIRRCIERSDNDPQPVRPRNIRSSSVEKQG